ncbi:MAG: DMT family transporter [Pseudomonadota bacterium]
MPLSIVLAALFAVVLWGASAVAAKIAVVTLSPISVALLRTIIGGFAALFVAVIMRVPFPATREQRCLVALSGFCGFVGFPILFTIGVKLTSANHASMILATLPIFTGAIAMAWDQKHPQRIWWIGCAVALAGEAWLISSTDSSNGQQSSVAGDMLVLLSNVFASLGYVVGGRLQRSGYAATGTTFWGAAIYAVVLLPFLPFVSGSVELSAASTQSWLAVLYLAIGVTIVGYICWYWALGKGGIERVGLMQFLQPVSGIILAWLLLGETINAQFIFASVLIFLGVAIAIRAK